MKTRILPAIIAFQVSFQLIAGGAVAAGSGQYCGMRRYYREATGESLPNAAQRIGVSIAIAGADVSSDAQARANRQSRAANRNDRAADRHENAADRAAAQGRKRRAAEEDRAAAERRARAEAHDRAAAEAESQAEGAAVVALGGAAIALAGNIGASVKKKRLMEVYNNLREARLLKHDPNSSDVSSLKHTLGLINGKSFKDPETGKKVKISGKSVADLSRAVIDAAREGLYCGPGGDLAVTDKFRDAVVQKLLRPTPARPVAAATEPSTAEATVKSVNFNASSNPILESFSAAGAL